MRIVSTTLAPNCSSVIGDALRSVVEWVDLCLLVDRDISDGSIDVARSIVGDKLRVVSLPNGLDFSYARNFALDAAATLGATWALTLDIDERMQLNGLEVRSMLAEQEQTGVVMVRDVECLYFKERFIHLPARGRWEGPVHEWFVCDSKVPHEGPMRFDELPKSPAITRARCERDISALTHHLATHAKEARWHDFLAESLCNADRMPEALASFERAASLFGSGESAAWALFRAAQVLVALGEHVRALDVVRRGLAYHSGITELLWLAGYCSFSLGQPQQALHWSKLAVAAGNYRGSGLQTRRLGFILPPAQWEGPYDIMVVAAEALGEHRLAAEASDLREQARAARIAALRS